MIKTADWQGTPVYTMENDDLYVSLCPSIGNNVYRIWDKKKEREVLRVPANPQELLNSPAHFGTPVLMPPNRIHKGAFRFGNRDYQFEINMPTGHHIHGLIKASPWTVSDTSENGAQLSITSTIALSDFPEIQKQYPHDLVLEMTYVLEGKSLVQKLKATNRGGEDAPFGYGLHTWFMIDGQPDQWKLKLPTENIWELNEDLMPTGQLLPLGEHQDMVSETGAVLQGKNLDTVFRIGNQPGTAVLTRNDGYRIHYEISKEFKHWVIFTKGQADQFVCLEPYTWVTNAPNLPLSPELTGLRGLAPQESLQLEVALKIIHP